MTLILVRETLGFVKDPKIEKDTQTPLAEAYGKTLNIYYCFMQRNEHGYSNCDQLLGYPEASSCQIVTMPSAKAPLLKL